MASFTLRRSVIFCLYLFAFHSLDYVSADPINPSAAGAVVADVSPGEVSLETDDIDPLTDLRPDVMQQYLAAAHGNGYYISPTQYQRLKVLFRLVHSKRAGNIFGSEYLGKRSAAVNKFMARAQKASLQYPFKRMDASEFLG